MKIIVAGDKNFKPYVDKAVEYNTKLGYESVVYDLGGLGYGKPFEGRVSDTNNAKIPCKPHIIEDVLLNSKDNEIVVWLDADALIVQPIDEIKQDAYDIGVTVRQPKQKEHPLPINAGIVFARKTPKALEFVKKWKELADQGISDQPPLNQLAAVNSTMIEETVIRDGVRIKVYPCATYNNFYFAKKKSAHARAKILHYKSKLRHLYPL